MNIDFFQAANSMTAEEKEHNTQVFVNSIDVLSVILKWADVYSTNIIEAWKAFINAGLRLNKDTEKMQSIARRAKQINQLCAEIDVIMKYDFCDPNKRKSVDKTILDQHDILLDVIEHATHVNIDGTPKEDWCYLAKIPQDKLHNLEDWWKAAQVGKQTTSKLEVL